jgi:hypothetical protein
MTYLPLVHRLLFVATLVLGAGLLQPAEAQQKQSGNAAAQEAYNYAPHYVERGSRPVGGYSLRFSDIWGPAKMPPAPRDFGPHFDYPPESLNSTPLHDPYPN